MQRVTRPPDRKTWANRHRRATPGERDRLWQQGSASSSCWSRSRASLGATSVLRRLVPSPEGPVVVRLGARRPRVRVADRGRRRTRGAAAPPAGHAAEALDALPRPGADPVLRRPDRGQRAEAGGPAGRDPGRLGVARGGPDGRDDPVALGRVAVPRPAHARARRAGARLHRPPRRGAPAVRGRSVPPAMGRADARHREAHDRAQDPQQAGRAGRARMAPDEGPPGRGRQDRRTHPRMARSRGRTRSSSTTSGSTARDIRTVSRAAPSRSAGGSSRSPTRTTP